MSAASIPRQWASSTTFSGGAHAGEDTKVDPGSAIAGNGFYPDLGFAAEHVNHQWSAMSSADRRAMMLAALQLRTLQLFGDTIDDTTESLAALALGFNTLVLKANSSGALQATQGVDRYLLVGTLAAITSLVHDAAEFGGRIVAIGSGGNGNCTSTDAGATWSAGGGGAVAIVTAAARARIMADATNSKFMLGGPGNNNVYNSADAAAWTARATGLTGVDGLGVTSTGHAVALSSGTNALAHATDGGTTWGAVTGFPSNAGSFDESGCIICQTGDIVYHVARLSSGATLQVSAGTISGGTMTWNVLASIPSTGLSSFSSRPRILQCRDTGLLVIVAPVAGGTLVALYASLDGEDWLGPSVVTGLFSSVDTFSVAGGKLFATVNDQVFRSDGIGL